MLQDPSNGTGRLGLTAFPKTGVLPAPGPWPGVTLRAEAAPWSPVLGSRLGPSTVDCEWLAVSLSLSFLPCRMGLGKSPAAVGLPQ
jgi:hypothetical protein